MPIANPLVQGGAPAGGYTPPPAGAPNDAPPAITPPASSRRFMAIGNGGFASPDNTSAHVGVLVLAALGVVVVLHLSGFRFAVDAGVTRS